ncbi:MAG: DUF2129 domain-containing protein, partial [Lactobacillus iners]|nr:DUF2129 domain-containing protein [Lactobacillus iners]
YIFQGFLYKFIIGYVFGTPQKIITMLTENKFVKSVEISKYNDLDFSSEHTTELMKNLKTTAENKLKNGEEF